MPHASPEEAYARLEVPCRIKVVSGADDSGRRELPPSVQDLLGELPVEPICVRVPVAVKLTGISRSTLYELIGAGEIATVKVGRSTFIRYDSLKQLFDRE